MTRRALTGAGIFNGQTLHRGKALLLHAESFEAIVDTTAIPPDAVVTKVPGGVLMPGFVDLQVNGGGGALFNDAPTVDTLKTIAQAHLSTGTRAFLPTLITDTPAKTQAAIEAVASAITAQVPGIVGLHLEGPHLSLARKGAHDGSLIRPMTQSDETLLCHAAQRLPNLMVTVAPESVGPEQIARLARVGVIVSIGHTDCTNDAARAAFDAGARCVTHLFNAMSQLGSREPGLVGAALAATTVSAGLIADAIHVHPETVRIALAAKAGPGAIFLVSDAMPPVGSDITEFMLSGQTVYRKDGRLAFADGTLAGADLTMAQAIGTLVTQVGVPLEMALRMATSVPASVLKEAGSLGAFTAGQAWSGIHLDDAFQVTFP